MLLFNLRNVTLTEFFELGIWKFWKSNLLFVIFLWINFFFLFFIFKTRLSHWNFTFIIEVSEISPFIFNAFIFLFIRFFRFFFFYLLWLWIFTLLEEVILLFRLFFLRKIIKIWKINFVFLLRRFTFMIFLADSFSEKIIFFWFWFIICTKVIEVIKFNTFFFRHFIFRFYTFFRFPLILEAWTTFIKISKIIKIKLFHTRFWCC